MLENRTTRTIHHEIPQSRGVNLTPLIDVVFQLLIFFMVASSLVRPNQIELDLPESTSGVKSQDAKSLSVTYRIRNGTPEIMLNSMAMKNLMELSEAMLSFRPVDGETDVRVDIQIERSVHYQDVIAVMDAVRDAGFPKFSLLTLMPSSRESNRDV